jgi:hypothetical protein
MLTKEILQSLCYYDKRNPDCSLDDEDIEEYKLSIKKNNSCSCDNCFYGRTKLAEELLKVLTTKNIYNK